MKNLKELKKYRISKNKLRNISAGDNIQSCFAGCQALYHPNYTGSNQVLLSICKQECRLFACPEHQDNDPNPTQGY